MNQLTSTQIRKRFLDFFESKNHMVEAGHSLIPNNDPTLLWINSGVAALKKYFDGTIKPQKPRITNAQKAIRSNDIENVGKTARHHTFFEMLGNFSIGDYFKKEAIEFAWEFLTGEQWMNFDPKRLYISVHTHDDEAYDIWTKHIGVDPSHVGRFEQNYWEIGVGPSGPNSEIIYDRGPQYDPLGKGEALFFNDEENDRYIEVWNIVFSQYNAQEGVPREEYKELPQKNIDTGMGFERLVCIAQEGETNFDTDLFLPIIKKCETLTDVKYDNEKIPFRVIADHIRCVTFALGDGALFSNEGRGYVLRRIIRRAIRFGKKLNIHEPFMYQLVDEVVKIMKDFYPELVEKQELIEKLVRLEEERFQVTLNDGEKMLQNLLLNTKGDVLSGNDVFKLYDTYGFPLELTQEIALENGKAINIEEFNEAMKQQKELSRANSVNIESFSNQKQDLMDFKAESLFIGYDQLSTQAKIIGLFKNGEKVDVLEDEGEIIFDQTVFYAESGGQIADSGEIIFGEYCIPVLNVTKAPFKQHLHKVNQLPIKLEVDQTVLLNVNVKKRELIKRNHSAVHLLNSALRKVVGTHIQQAGSFVGEDYARFDFTHYEKVTSNQLIEIERLVNNWIFDSLDVCVRVLPIQEAKQTGALAFFDEKYGDFVRVVSMGEDVSIEFCGGTHVKNTIEIGACKIIGEESVGSGTRRISLITSSAVLTYYQTLEERLQSITTLTNVNSFEKINEKIESYILTIESLKNELTAEKQSNINGKIPQLLSNVISIKEIQCLIVKENIDKATARMLVDRLKEKMGQESVIIGLFSFEQEGFTFVSSTHKAVHAGQLVKEFVKIGNGNGGGKPDFAQGGIKDIDRFSEIESFVIDKLNDLL